MNKKKVVAKKSEVKKALYGRTIKDPAKPSSLDPLEVERAVKKISALRVHSFTTPRS